MRSADDRLLQATHGVEIAQYRPVLWPGLQHLRLVLRIRDRWLLHGCPVRGMLRRLLKRRPLVHVVDAHHARALGPVHMHAVRGHLRRVRGLIVLQRRLQLRCRTVLSP